MVPASGASGAAPHIGTISGGSLSLLVEWRREARRVCGGVDAQGSGEGANMVGDCHERGNGVEHDLAAAALWYSRSAAVNCTAGLENYARCLAGGRGVQLDLSVRPRPCSYGTREREGLQRCKKLRLGT